ncbi:hypothetical protein QTP88_007384 [Uroleucon formosanum]
MKTLRRPPLYQLLVTQHTLIKLAPQLSPIDIEPIIEIFSKSIMAVTLNAWIYLLNTSGYGTVIDNRYSSCRTEYYWRFCRNRRRRRSGRDPGSPDLKTTDWTCTVYVTLHWKTTPKYV